MMSPFHPHFHLGADGMIDEASAAKTLWRSLNWTFHICRAQSDYSSPLW